VFSTDRELEILNMSIESQELTVEHTRPEKDHPEQGRGGGFQRGRYFAK